MGEDKFVVRMGHRGYGKIYALELMLNKAIAEIDRLRDCIGHLKETLQVYHEAMQESVRHDGKREDNGVPDSMLSNCCVCKLCSGAYSFDYCPNCVCHMRGE